jgi:hypothetical protein
MQGRTRRLFIPVVVAGLALAACHQKAATPAKVRPATVEHIEGEEVSRITLTERAAERLAIKTDVVRDVRTTRSGMRKGVPYAAVLYDANGRTWVYTSPSSLVFVRRPIQVEYIEGAVAVLSDGPPAGTAVVTTGAAELFGAEFEIGH